MIRARVNMEAYPRLRTDMEALRLSPVDMKGPVLTRLGQVHRAQMVSAFTSQGASTATGVWAPLNPSYRKRKAKAAPGKRLLVLTGDMRARFTKQSHPAYVQDYKATSDRAGVFLFGAMSDVAAAHLYGNPALAKKGSSALARKIFGGIAPRLQVRNMIAKTTAQVAQFHTAVREFYIARVRQVIRAMRPSRPR